MGLRHRRRYQAGPVCERWRSFENFIADMGKCPSSKHTIDREDNSKGYEPSNCRWATMKKQQNNRTNNRLLTHNGKTQTLQMWSEETGIARSTITARIRYLDWPVKKALTTPVKGRSS